MIKVFLDSSVLVAASASISGASALVLGYCRKKKIMGFISLEVIGEARKNINLKLGQKEKERFTFFLKKTNLFLIPSPSVEEIAKCEKVINIKDAPILAAGLRLGEAMHQTVRGEAGLKSSASFLLTLDKKHFLSKEVKKFVQPLKIVTPGDFVKSLHTLEV